MNTDFIPIVEKLKSYRKKGHMNRFEIDEMIQMIEQACNDEANRRVGMMMEEITRYVSSCYNHQQNLTQYVHHHLEQVAALLNKSERTIYRRLKEDSFTLIEKKTIQKYMNETWTI